ncbi:MAG: peroxidase-related enzyme [Rhodobacterales bacterium]|nr:peroxidase-related enzyme [Rhodobacterales bacterium]
MSDVIRKFTKVIPAWRARLAPGDTSAMTPVQARALSIAAPLGQADDLLRLLAHDPETLSAHTPLFHGIMYGAAGLDRAARELAAIGASMENGCVFCAATHADRHIRLVNDTRVVDEVFRFGADADLGPRDRAVFDFARHLSDAPPRADREDVENLRGVGLNDTDILDLVLSTALFAWTNRFTHVLGDPVRAP